MAVKRLICRKEAATVVNMTTTDGLVTIRNLNYEFKDEYINVYNFYSTEFYSAEKEIFSSF